MAEEVRVGVSTQDALELIAVCMTADGCPVITVVNLHVFLTLKLLNYYRCLPMPRAAFRIHLLDHAITF